MKKIGIIGFGNIGKKLYNKIREKGWEVCLVANSFKFDTYFPLEMGTHPIDRWFEYCHDLDLVFLAIPTLDDGKIAKNYILLLTQKGIPVVTCEKGALANHFEDLEPYLDRIGYSATVGGGSGIIDFLRQRFFSGTREVHVILNGTLNYIWDDLKMGNPLGHIVEEITKLGYTEPKKNDVMDIISTEIESDATKKATILFNLCFQSKLCVQAQHIHTMLSKEVVEQAIREAMIRRFVVSFVKEEFVQEEPSTLLAFKDWFDGWQVSGGFKRTDQNPLIARLCQSATWVNNAILIVEGKDGEDGVYVCSGPGAGASPTTAAMIRDAERLLF